MENKQFGFITTSGILAGLLTALFVVGIGLAYGGVLFNPGPLNAQAGASMGGVTSHADLQGKCAGCHTAFWEKAKMADRCVVCHADIRTQLQDPASLHGIFQNVFTDSACRSCHPEHRGISAPLTVLNQNNFPHEKFGYPLVGMHLTTNCAGCHANNVYSGAPVDCYSCHASRDIHAGKYGANCSACHTPAGWSQVNFDHNLSAFKLIGKHANIGCTDCHVNNDFTNTPTDCNSCHAKDDTHNGQLGTDCGACHSPEGWLPATFDHSTSAFPLTGQHTNIPCTGCHINNVFKGTPTDCYSCHSKNDKHNGQFGRDCGACHTTSGWLPANFNHSAFPLTAGHAGLACTRCHSNGVYVGLSASCVSCHRDPAFHAGLFGTNCGKCHNTSNWYAPYNGPHPNDCDGPCLTHANASCRDCHTVNLSSATCTVCHQNGIPTGD